VINPFLAYSSSPLLPCPLRMYWVLVDFRKSEELGESHIPPGGGEKVGQREGSDWMAHPSPALSLSCSGIYELSASWFNYALGTTTQSLDTPNFRLLLIIFLLLICMRQLSPTQTVEFPGMKLRHGAPVGITRKGESSGMGGEDDVLFLGIKGKPTFTSLIQFRFLWKLVWWK